MTAAFPALPAEIAPAAGPFAGPEGVELPEGAMYDGYPATEELGYPGAAAPEGYMYADEAGLYSEAAAPEGAEGAWEPYPGEGYPEDMQAEDAEGYGPPAGAGWAAFPGAVEAAQAPGYAPGSMLPDLAPAGAASYETAAGPEGVGARPC
jgi:hypothetical protein